MEDLEDLLTMAELIGTFLLEEAVVAEDMAAAVELAGRDQT